MLLNKLQILCHLFNSVLLVLLFVHIATKNSFQNKMRKSVVSEEGNNITSLTLPKTLPT
jgi:hypothetical protein